MESIPAAVLDRFTGVPGSEATSCRAVPFEGSLGVATDTVTRLTGTYRAGGSTGDFRLFRKSFRPLTSGRHALAARDRGHWAYWRREALAYDSGLLPTGPGLRAPLCFGVADGVVYLEDVRGEAESPVLAAGRLGRWQATAATPAVPWLSGHQLAQRVAVTTLDWSAVEADPRMPALWNRRAELLDSLDELPRVLSHGDFHGGNMLAAAGQTVAFDWSTFGLAPPGADLAHLLLASFARVLTDPTHIDELTDAYLDGLNGRFKTEDVGTCLRATIALTGASRVHWMLTAGHEVPAGYVECVAGMAP